MVRVRSQHKAIFLVCLLSAAVNAYLLIRLQAPCRCVSTSETLASKLVIFVGENQWSGTELARALQIMIGAHPDISCRSIFPGKIFRFLGIGRMALSHQSQRWSAVSNASDEVPVSDEVMDRARRAFVAEIIGGQGPPAQHLCSKDPLLQQHMKPLANLFPKSMFLFVIRDGRAVAHSVALSRRGSTNAYDTELRAARYWNDATRTTIRDCSQLPERCMTVFYEKLVTDPSTQMKEVLRFLDIPWHNDILRHHGSKVK